MLDPCTADHISMPLDYSGLMFVMLRAVCTTGCIGSMKSRRWRVYCTYSLSSPPISVLYGRARDGAINRCQVTGNNKSSTIDQSRKGSLEWGAMDSHSAHDTFVSTADCPIFDGTG